MAPHILAVTAAWLMPRAYFISLHSCAPCRHLAHTYGAGWADPNSSSDAVTQKTPDCWHIQQALLSRLSVTTWGDTPWSERIKRCAALQAAKTAEAAVELGGSSPSKAAGQLQNAQTVQEQQHTAEMQEALTAQQQMPDTEEQQQQQEDWQLQQQHQQQELLQQLTAQDDDDFEDDTAAGEAGRGQHQQELLRDDLERDQWEDRQQQHQHQHKRNLLRQLL